MKYAILLQLARVSPQVTTHAGIKGNCPATTDVTISPTIKVHDICLILFVQNQVTALNC